MDSQLKSCQGALAYLATRDEDARRRHPESEDDDGWLTGIASPFSIDSSKIMNCRALRRLGDKTQVRPLETNTHIRRRLSHSLGVTGLAVPAAELLGLNTDLVRAIGLSHDMGHTPFGHTGELVLSRLSGKKIRHEVLGVILSQKVERRGRGLNLTHQTLAGILNHARGAGPFDLDPNASEEANLVMCDDKIDYFWADYHDILERGDCLDPRDYPELVEIANWFGRGYRSRTAKCFRALCLESTAAGRIAFWQSEEAIRLNRVREIMYGKIYNAANRRTEIVPLIERAYHLVEKVAPHLDPVFFIALLGDQELLGLAAKDELAPTDLRGLSATEILANLEGRNFDLTDPDLDW